MATKKKMLQAAAGNAGGGAGPDVEDVFSTYLYTGTASNQTITNGIDLSGEGGLVWIKGRTNAQSHGFFDTERGVNKALASDANWAEFSYQGVNAFNSNGFQVGYQNEYNQFTLDYASWTFRKAPKFFDVVEISITRDGSNNLTSNNSNATVINNVVYVNHNLDSVPGLWIQKSLSYAASWYVRSTSFTGFLKLDSNTAKAGSITHTATSTQVMLDDYGTGSFGVGTHEYIIYLFAAGGDGEFGPNGDQDIIKCGVFTPNTSGEVTVDLGFEPQFVIYKNIDSPDDWIMFDNMRGWGSSVQDWQKLAANSGAAEEGLSQTQLTSTGFTTGGTGSLNNKNYIYMAIRRGTKVPESGTEAFDIQSLNNAGPYSVGFPTDLLLLNITGGSSSNTYVGSRLTGGDKYLRTSSTAAEGTSSGIWSFDLQDSFTQNASPSSPWLGYHWKRAPGYFDVVAYKGDGVAGRTVSHNLGVAPELIIAKNRTYNGSNWVVWCDQLTRVTEEPFMILNGTNGKLENNAYWNNGAHTDSVFETGSNLSVNGSGYSHIAYLFATLPGVSKVGSYTGNGTSQTIDCGFTSGARFILIKRTDSTGDWYIWDTARGIVAGNDPHLSLNTTAAEVTSDDSIDPDNSGFIVNQVSATNINVSSASYIFYAIA